MSLAIVCSDIVCMLHHNGPNKDHPYQHSTCKILVNKLDYKLARTCHRYVPVKEFKFHEIVENIVTLGCSHVSIFFKYNLKVQVEDI